MHMIVISYFDDDTSAEIRGMATMTEDSDLYHDITKLKAALEIFGIGYNIYTSYWIRKAKKLGIIGYGREPASIVSIDGGTFANAIFPFLMKDKRQESVIAEVNPHNVFGGQYYHINPRNTDDEIWLMDELNRHTADGDHERAIYIKAGAFPFYIPIEGKNRVTLFRKHNRNIVCLMKKHIYPDPGDLRIIKYGSFLTLKHTDPSKLDGLVTPGYQLINPDESILAFPQSYNILRNYGVDEEEVELRPWMIYKFEKARMITQGTVSENCYIR